MDCFYIGTKQKMFAVRPPSVNMPSEKQGFSNQIQFLNGGTSIRRSVAGHKRYVLTWNSVERDDARIILDLADGIYGNGEIYFHDPFSSDRNVLPQWWASPSQGGYDGLPLNAGARGSLYPTPPNSLNFPLESIQYTVTPNASRRVWIPIPPGYTAHVGAYGQNGTGGTLEVQPTKDGFGTGAPTVLTLMDVSNNARFNSSFNYSSNYDGIELYLGGDGTVFLTAMMVQVLPTGVTPEAGGFISGQGNSGLSFVTQPTYTPYSAAFTRAGLAAELVETGGWSF
jgi:hypothetical protein